MASLKPLILIFQEIAQPSATPATPDLNAVIVGPAYDVLDYPDDGDQILLPSAYGQLEQDATYAPPATGIDAVTVLDGGFPGQSAGARVDHGSARVTLRTPRVVLGSTYLSSGIAPVLGTRVTTTAADRTLITFTSVTTNLVQAGVQPGDRIILTSSSGQTVARTIASVGEPNGDGLIPAGNEALLRVTQQLPTPDATATGSMTAVAESALVGAFATGSITVPAGGGAALVDGETFTLNDGVNPATVFEFDSGGGVGVGRVAVPFTGGDTQATVRGAIVTAIQGVGAGLRISASPGGAGVVNLAADRCLVAGNVAITDTVADAGFLVVGMAGGADEGETFTLNDGVNPATVFEFDRDGVVAGGRVAVPITPGWSASQVRDAMVTAINGVVGGLAITAAPGSGNTLNLTNDAAGAFGNVAITETVANAVFLVSGMTGGTTGADRWVYDALGEARIERTLSTRELTDPTRTLVVFPEPGSDKLVIKGGVTLSLPLTPRPTVATPSPSASTVTRALSYAQVYLGYRALRQDLQGVRSAVPTDQQTVNGIPTIRGIGKLDARNPLAVGVKLALDNGGNVPIYYYGVSADDSTGYANARARTASRSDLYVFVNLTQDLNVHAAAKAAYEQQASPIYARDRGVMQRFRIALGSVSLPVAQTVYEGSISGVSQTVGSAVTNLYRTISIDAASTGSVGVRSVVPGDSVTIGLVRTGTTAWQNRRGTHRVGHVNSSVNYPNPGDPSALEIIPGTSRWDDTAAAGADDIEILVRGPDGTVKISNLARLDVSTGGGGTLGTIRFAMLSPTVTGGPYTITYAAGAALAITVVGFAITITVGGTTTHAQVAAAVAANATLSALMTAVVTAGGTNVVDPGTQSPVAPASIMPITGSCTAQVILNDALFNQLEDASATFLQAGVRAGDRVEIPLDPNDYGPSAFSGRVLSYPIATTLNENRFRIANGFDDAADTARELPHYFARDFQDRYVDITAPNAIAYRVRRTLTTGDQALALVAIAQSVRSKRLTLMWPDLVGVADLRDGSLPRTLPSVRTLAGYLPSYYLACAVAGVIAGTPPQMGLTNGTFIGVDRLKNASDMFSEEELSTISDGGFFVCTQEVEGALPSCNHQLTTDPTSLETGELSVVKNVDYLSVFYQALLKSFLGQYNNIPEALNEIYRAVRDNTTLLTGRFIQRIGPPLLSGSIISLAPSAAAADTAEMVFSARVARPLNNIAFHLVVQR